MADQPPVPAGFDAENAQNFEDIEAQFAVVTVEFLEVRIRDWRSQWQWQ